MITARSARVAVLRNPLIESLEPGRFAAVPEGAKLADLLPADAGAWVCRVNDEWIGREHWHYLPPPGAIVVFACLPAGGGGGRGSARLLLQIALFTFLASPLGGFLDGGLLTAGERLVGGIAGNLLINALIPLDASNAANSGGAQQFSAQAQANLARVGQPVPEIMGYDYGWPDLGAQPYSLYAGNEQFLYLALCVTRGQYQISRVGIGDTSITSFADATVIRVGPAQDTLTGPGTGVLTLADQTMVNPRMVTSEDVSAVEMKTLDYAGPFAACRPEGTVTSIGIDILLPRGLDGGRSIAWKVETRRIDDFDAALSAWTVLDTQTYSTASPEPQRMSFNYLVAAARYQVRLLRTDVRSTDNGSAHDISWLALRGEMAGDNLSAGDDCTYVCIKIRASGQLSGSLRFRVMGTRMLPTWTGSAWTAATLTRNPAWALARVLKARGLPDSQIDLGQLLTLATIWEARQDNFDFRFDSQTSTWDALAQIARVGRAVPIIRAGKYSFVRDQKEDAPVALYGMRNIRRGSFALAIAMPEADPMTALDLEYFDHRRWDWVTVTAQAYNDLVYGYRGDANRPAAVPGPDALARGRVKMPGIIGESHAIRTAVYILADGLYRRMVATYSTELDGLLPAPMSLVTLQHDIANFGQGGDVALWTVGTLTIGTTEPLVWTAGATHYIRLMRPTGTLTPAIACLPGATDHDVVLASAPDFTPLFDNADRERTRYVFGAADEVGALAKLRAIVPRSEREIEHRCVLEDDRVHTADSEWLPALGVPQDPPSDGGDVGSTTDGYVVSLPAFADGVVGDSVIWPLYLYNDGTVGHNGNGGGVETIPGWLYPQTVTSGVCALYEVFVSALPGGGSMGGAALDTWLSMGTSRTFEWTTSFAPGGSDSVELQLQFRDVATGTVQASTTITFNLQSSTGGG